MSTPAEKASLKILDFRAKGMIDGKTRKPITPNEEISFISTFIDDEFNPILQAKEKMIIDLRKQIVRRSRLRT